MSKHGYNRRLRYPRLACHHLISRVVHKRMLLTEEAMEQLRHVMRSQAAFCGMEVLTYCFLGNHFHIFVRLDPKETSEMDDAELMRRFRALYGGRRSASLGMTADRLEAVLKLDGAAASELRRRLRARMGDVSVFMRELKTRFTLWYNAHHGTVGTFWAERFRSVIVEAGSRAEKLVAAYIDLNPVRAGLAKEAETYTYCGYGEACAGNLAARRGIARVEGVIEWTSGVRARYKARMVGRLGGRHGSTGEDASAAGAETGTPAGLHAKCRTFGESLVVGSRRWVETFEGSAPGEKTKKRRIPKPVFPTAADVDEDVVGVSRRS